MFFLSKHCLKMIVNYNTCYSVGHDTVILKEAASYTFSYIQ